MIMKKNMKMKRVFITIAMLVFATMIHAQDEPFWLGADISGTNELERRGDKLYNARGEERENTQLMKECGLNAVRLRVWVNNKDGLCGKDDVLDMAKRAQKLGMAIMIDFHYSDWWADPGQQNVPKAWKDMGYKKMRKALAAHTKDVLRHLKDNGIDVKWVQIGNETTHGFLWDTGRAETNMKQYAGLSNAGYKAAKSVYPNAICIVQLDAGCDIKRYRFIFDGLEKYHSKFDMIGLSVYPHWDQEAKLETTDEGTLRDVISNINTLYEIYKKPLMIVETGYEVSKPEAGRDFMIRLIEASMTKTNGHCKGVFYWAPELEGDYPLGAFKNGRPTEIMDAFRLASKHRMPLK